MLKVCVIVLGNSLTETGSMTVATQPGTATSKNSSCVYV